jgi:hypothetical protein
MDFNIHRDDVSESSVTLTIMGLYTDEEAEALDELNAWDQPCIPDIYAVLEVWRWDNPEITIKAPTFYDLYDPGIRMEDFSPRNADRFQAQFHDKYGRRIQNALGPVLQQFRRGEHQNRIRERDNYFGKNQEPKQISYQPQRRLPRR